MKSRFILTLFLVILVGGLISCTDQEKSTPDIYLVAQSTPSKEIMAYVDITAEIPLVISLDITSFSKDPLAALSSLQDVTISSYHVGWTREDGGTTTPDAYDFTVTGVVTAGGTLTYENLPLMMPTQVTQPPFDQLYPWNGGVDVETNKSMITCKATVTFYGRTSNGRDVNAVYRASYIFHYGGV